MANQQTKEPSAAEQVQEIADRQIETIRLMLCPEESDVTLGDNGTLDTVLQLDGDIVEVHREQFVHDPKTGLGREFVRRGVPGARRDVTVRTREIATAREVPRDHVGQMGP